MAGPLYRRKRTCAAHKLMSALGQKADIPTTQGCACSQISLDRIRGRGSSSLALIKKFLENAFYEAVAKGNVTVCVLVMQSSIEAIFVFVPIHPI